MSKKTKLKHISEIEILAPVGGLDMVSAAVYCGANAIYLGFPTLNARRKSEEFSEKTLKEIIDFCHIRNVKVFLTLNTLAFDDELLEAKEIILKASLLGIDAIIVQDLGVAKLVKEISGDMPLHGSTQMSVTSVKGALQLEKMGFSRVILGRELSKSQIEAICSATEMEVEVFVHGAHCMSISGQCYLSSMIGGRSGNRGLCAQPCRLPFSSEKNKKDYSLSLKDLSIIKHMNTLKEIGVKSIKIEGRMKRPEYVAAAVTACKEALKDVSSNDFENAFSNLEKVFSRSGFSDGFFKNEINSDMFGTRLKSDVTATSKVLNVLKNLYHKETPLLKVDFSYTQKENQPISLSVIDETPLNNRDNTAIAIGNIPEKAITNATDEQMAFKSINKLGSTPFFTDFESTTFDIDNSLMVRMSDINKIRRQAIEKLMDNKKEGFKKATIDYRINHFLPFDNHKTPKLRVRFEKFSNIDFKNIINLVDYIYIPAREICENLSNENIINNFSKIIIEAPRIIFSDDILIKRLQKLKESGFKNLEVNNLAQINIGSDLGFNLIGGFSLNVFNTLSLEEYKDLGVKETTLSIELDLNSIKNLDHAVMPIGSVIHGHLPAMTTRNCPGRAVDNCKNCNKTRFMYDRLNNKYIVSCENSDFKEYTEIYNPHILYMGNKIKDLNLLDFVTLYFTKEDKDKSTQVIDHYYSNLNSLSSQNLGYDSITSGLFYKKIF